MSGILPLQCEPRSTFPTILGNVDHLEFEKELKRMDETLRLSGTEIRFVETALANCLEVAKAGQELRAKERIKYHEQTEEALRCTVLQRILGEVYRGTSRRMAERPPFQWFSAIDQLGVVVFQAKPKSSATPIGSIYNPLVELHLPMHVRGEFSPNLGMCLGLPPFASVALYYAILVGGIWWLWRMLLKEKEGSQ